MLKDNDEDEVVIRRTTANFQEGTMVCFACNGKGYVRANDHELPCIECQGQGEFFITDLENSKPLESTLVNQAQLHERVVAGA